MYNSIQKSDLFGNGMAQDMYMGMYLDEVAKRGMYEKGGIAEMLIKQYEKNSGASSAVAELQGTDQKIGTELSQRIKNMINSNQLPVSIKNIIQDLSSMVAKFDMSTSSAYGTRVHPILGIEKFHHGIDFALPLGQEIKAPTPGKVIFSGTKGGYGNTVILDHGNGFKSMYSHLLERTVGEGSSVGKNTPIGKVGSTGLSTGPHLHFEVLEEEKPIDPKSLSSQKIVKAL